LRPIRWHTCQLHTKCMKLLVRWAGKCRRGKCCICSPTQIETCTCQLNTWCKMSNPRLSGTCQAHRKHRSLRQEALDISLACSCSNSSSPHHWRIFQLCTTGTVRTPSRIGICQQDTNGIFPWQLPLIQWSICPCCTGCRHSQRLLHLQFDKFRQHKSSDPPVGRDNSSRANIL
jgi:hypothetical protein